MAAARADSVGEDRLDRCQMFTIWMTQMFQGLQMTMAFAISAYMVRSFCTGDGCTEQTIAKMAGLLAAAGPFPRSLVMVPWGLLSDRIGRKRVIVPGGIMGALGILGFGFAGSLEMAIAARVAPAILNGSGVALRAMVGESCTPSNQARAFAILTVGRSGGTVMGPLLAGLLAQPCELYGSGFPLCTPGGLFRQRPFLLPCAVAAAWGLMAVVLNIFLMKETLPRLVAHSSVTAHSRNEAGDEEEQPLLDEPVEAPYSQVADRISSPPVDQTKPQLGSRHSTGMQWESSPDLRAMDEGRRSPALLNGGVVNGVVVAGRGMHENGFDQEEPTKQGGGPGDEMADQPEAAGKQEPGGWWAWLTGARSPPDNSELANPLLNGQHPVACGKEGDMGEAASRHHPYDKERAGLAAETLEADVGMTAGEGPALYPAPEELPAEDGPLNQQSVAPHAPAALVAGSSELRPSPFAAGRVEANGLSANDMERIDSAGAADSIIESKPLAASDPAQEPAWYRNYSLLVALGAGAAVAVLWNFLEELTPIFVSAPIERGGLGLPLSAFTVPIMVGGIVMFGFALTAFPELQKRVGALRSVRIGLLGALPTALLVPAAAAFVPHQGLEEGALLLAMVTKAVFKIMAMTSSTILINLTAPKQNIGAVNGLAMALGSASRALGPVLAGLSWAAVVTAPVFPGHQAMPFLVMGLAAVGLQFLYGRIVIPPGGEHRKGRRLRLMAD